MLGKVIKERSVKEKGKFLFQPDYLKMRIIGGSKLHGPLEQFILCLLANIAKTQSLNDNSQLNPLIF